MSKICKNCGEELNDMTKFCPKCGTSAEETSAQPGFYETLQPPVIPTASSIPEPQKKKSVVVPVIIAVVLILAVVCGIFFAYLGISRKNFSDIFGSSKEKTTETLSVEDKAEKNTKKTESNSSDSDEDSDIDSSKITVPAIKKLVDNGTIKPTISVDSYISYNDIMNVYNNMEATALTSLSEKKAAAKKYPTLQGFVDLTINYVSDSMSYNVTDDEVLEEMKLSQGNGFVVYDCNEYIYAFSEAKDYSYCINAGSSSMTYMDFNEAMLWAEGTLEGSALIFVNDEDSGKLDYIIYGNFMGDETVCVCYLPSGQLYMYIYKDENGQTSYFDSSFNTMNEGDTPDDIIEGIQNI